MIDFDKFAKYSKPGPRYTSYPTAIEFSEKFGVKSYIEKLKSIKANQPLSLYFHLPFCKEVCYFCGCNVVYTSREDAKLKYIRYLKKELDLLSSYVRTNNPVIQLHFGGGTPTYFSASQLDEILSYIKKTFTNFEKKSELSCEVDPRYFNADQAKVLAQNGFTRISFGVQDFDLKVQKAVNRVQSFELTQNVIKIAREHSINSVNIDLIYGLPYQSVETFANTLELVQKLDPDRIAVFNYAHVPWIRATMKKIDEKTLPKVGIKLEILKYTIEFLQSIGYEMIGMDHFAKRDDELFIALQNHSLYRNFQGYTTKAGTTLIGIGLSSIGNGEDYYAQNFKTLSDYEKALDNGVLPIHKGIELSSDDLIRKYVIMQLMSNFYLNIKEINNKFNIDFFKYFKDEIEHLEEFIYENLVTITPDIIRISTTGSMLIRNIVMVFDSYYNSENKKKFSKTL